MMKKRIILMFISLCMVQMVSWAQHYVGAMVDGSVAWQLDREYDVTQAKLGGGGSIGGLYQYQFDRFLMQTGLGASQMYLSQGIDTISIMREMQDTEGYTFNYCGELHNRVDNLLLTEVMVPVMLGTKVRSLHLLVGAKLAVAVYGYTMQDARLTTWGDYGDRYYGVLENMPQHGFYTDKAVATRDTMSFRADVRLCAELGWSWPLTKEPVKVGAPVLQVGAFVEYGIGNPLKRTENTAPLTEVNAGHKDGSMCMDVKMHHVYSTLNRDQHVMNNLRVGVRVAVLFPVAKGKNPFCRCMEGASTKYLW